ncbi:MAG: helix-turn-helix domain-containing protein [Actinomycetota bacterium]|nr:helix-turn-helix domain-containing protein [Actinomycetota bacterium]
MASRAIPETAALQLLRLLANHGTVADITALAAPQTERDLALRIREAFDRTRRREAELSALVETARDLASLSDPRGVLDAIVRRARFLLGTDLAYLTLYDPERGDTYVRATDGSISAQFQSVRLSLGDGLGGLAASARKAYWTADYFADERFQHTNAIDSAVGEEGIVAICGTPLIVEDDFVGVLFAANRSPRPFSHDEVALLGSLATLAAVSIVQVRSLAETEQALAALSQAHETVRRHTAGVERAAAAHDRFADLVLAGGGADDITKALVDLLGGWAVVLDERGVRRSEAGSAPGGHPDPTGRDPLADGTLADAAAGSGRLAQVGDRYAAVITAAHEPLGLLVLGGVELTADDADRRTVERAAMVTALVLLFERPTADAQQQMRTDLVADLVSGRGDAAELTTAARTHGLDTHRPFCLLAVTADDSVSRRALVLSTHAAIGTSGVVGEHDGTVVALVAGADAGAMARTVAARLVRAGTATVAGVGPLDGVGGIATAFTEAVRTTRAMVALGHAGSGAAAADLGFAGLVVGSQPDVTAYVDRALGAVTAYDKARGTDLVSTLEAYFEAGGSPRRAGTALHVHVNTVVQRLDRVSALLGSDWQQPDRALEVQLALRLRRLMLR